MAGRSGSSASSPARSARRSNGPSSGCGRPSGPVMSDSVSTRVPGAVSDPVTMSDRGKVRVSETRRGNIVVTGSTSGIGAAVGNRLADLGYRVYAGVHDDEDIITVNKRGNPRVTPVVMDVTSDASVATAAEQIGEAVG